MKSSSALSAPTTKAIAILLQYAGFAAISSFVIQLKTILLCVLAFFVFSVIFRYAFLVIILKILISILSFILVHKISPVREVL